MVDLLTVDIGNSFTHFGFFAGRNLIIEIRWPTVSLSLRKRKQKKKPSASLGQSAILFSLLPKVRAVILATVVPEKGEELKNFIERCYEKKVYSLKDGLKTGLKIDYGTKESPLGEDRITAAAGVVHYYKKGGIIVDLGTATTFSTVSSRGEFLGGLIAPGIISSLYFLKRTSRLQTLADIFTREGFIFREERPPYIGKETREGIEKGNYLYTKYAIEGIIKKLKGEMKDRDVWVFLSGGLAFTYKYILKGIDIVDPFLNLRGLCEIYYLNRE